MFKVVSNNLKIVVVLASNSNKKLNQKGIFEKFKSSFTKS